MTAIVVIDVSETVAPTPSTLQQCGAFVSHGGTTLAAGTFQLLTAPTSINSILTAPAAISSISWSGNVVTATASAALPFTDGDTVNLTLAGFTPIGYNGTFACTITGANTFTYALGSNPGSETALGTYVSVSASEISNMNAIWFAQNGAPLAVWVLELGALGTVAAIAALSTYISNNPNTSYMPGATGYFYHYIVPPAFANQSTFLTLVEAYSALNAMTYFDTTMTTGNYTNFTTAAPKSVIGEVQAPAAPSTEFSIVATAFNVLNRNPSATNKVAPLCYSFQYDVTPYPLPGNSTILAQLQAAGVNVVGTGAEGGISNTILLYGTTMDINAIDYWYAVDWVIQNENVALSNEVINGSNSTINPLYYNQQGINTLQSVAAGVISSAISYGLVLGTMIQTELDPTTFAKNVAAGVYAGNAVVNAVPFTTYVAANPSAYRQRKYGGLGIAIVPQTGFEQIIVNLNASQFA